MCQSYLLCTMWYSLKNVQWDASLLSVRRTLQVLYLCPRAQWFGFVEHLWSGTSTEVNTRGGRRHRSAPTQGALMWATATQHILSSSLYGGSAACHVSVRYMSTLPFPAVHHQRHDRGVSIWVNLKTTLPQNKGPNANFNATYRKDVA